MKLSKTLLYASTLSLSLSIFSISSMSNKAFAADNADNNTASSITTNAKLTFKAPDKQDPTSVTPPVDPNNPSQPGNNPADPGDPDNSGTHSGGPLSIDYAPSFDFGIGTISGQTKTYNLNDAKYDTGNGQSSSKSHSPFVQISDNRGTGEGWTLNASISNFTNSAADKTNTLAGAQVSLQSKDSDPQPGYSNQSAKPSLNSQPITLSNSSQNIMSASKDTGLGTWLERFDPNKVTLTVPGGSARSGVQYNANITWNLSASPAN